MTENEHIEYFDLVICQNGAFTKEFKLSDKLSVKFKTLTKKEQIEVMEYVGKPSKENPAEQTTVMTKIEACLLAKQLISFGNFNTQLPFDKKLEYLYNLQLSCYNLLQSKRLEFQEYIEKLEEAAINFQKPQ
jgi:hypothetical protein